MTTRNLVVSDHRRCGIQTVLLMFIMYRVFLTIMQYKESYNSSGDAKCISRKPSLVLDVQYVVFGLQITS